MDIMNHICPWPINAFDTIKPYIMFIRIMCEMYMIDIIFDCKEILFLVVIWATW